MDQELGALIIRLDRENRFPGYDRMAGALANLGYTVSDGNVDIVLNRHSIQPTPERKTATTRKACIRMHMVSWPPTFSPQRSGRWVQKTLCGVVNGRVTC
jgi:hypothetical protein